MIGVTRALQIVRDEAGRQAAYETRARVVRTIGDLARGGGTLAPPEEDDAPLLGTPAEIIARIRQLQAGGVENILLVDPAANVASLRAFAGEIMPAFQDVPATVRA
jgi:alkanesulfonate monooxygenase SsuD/methylene tetrahydromethanopterin reductase-like flavin-dependent oxidoreductase (luciferase family)